MPFDSTNSKQSSLQMWNASRFCVSSLRRGHANLLCIVSILVYVLPKQVHSVQAKLAERIGTNVKVRRSVATSEVKYHLEVGSEPILAVLQCQANS